MTQISLEREDDSCRLALNTAEWIWAKRLGLVRNQKQVDIWDLQVPNRDCIPGAAQGEHPVIPNNRVDSDSSSKDDGVGFASINESRAFRRVELYLIGARCTAQSTWRYLVSAAVYFVMTVERAHVLANSRDELPVSNTTLMVWGGVPTACAPVES